MLVIELNVIERVYLNDSVTCSGLRPYTANNLLHSALHVLFIYKSTQPCIPPGSLNRVPASAGVKAGKSPLPGGR